MKQPKKVVKKLSSAQKEQQARELDKSFEVLKLHGVHVPDSKKYKALREIFVG